VGDDDLYDEEKKILSSGKRAMFKAKMQRLCRSLLARYRSSVRERERHNTIVSIAPDYVRLYARRLAASEQLGLPNLNAGERRRYEALEKDTRLTYNDILSLRKASERWVRSHLRNPLVDIHKRRDCEIQAYSYLLSDNTNEQGGGGGSGSGRNAISNSSTNISSGKGYLSSNKQASSSNTPSKSSSSSSSSDFAATVAASAIGQTSNQNNTNSRDKSSGLSSTQATTNNNNYNKGFFNRLVNNLNTSTSSSQDNSSRGGKEEEEGGGGEDSSLSSAGRRLAGAVEGLVAGASTDSNSSSVTNLTADDLSALYQSLSSEGGGSSNYDNASSSFDGTGFGQNSSSSTGGPSDAAHLLVETAANRGLPRSYVWVRLSVEIRKVTLCLVEHVLFDKFKAAASGIGSGNSNTSSTTLSTSSLSSSGTALPGARDRASSSASSASSSSSLLVTQQLVLHHSLHLLHLQWLAREGGCSR
jgi:hypothetical protein